MKLPPPYMQRFFIFLIVAGLIVIGAVAWVGFVELPQVNSLRTKIDKERASIILAQQQQQNIEIVRKQLTDVQTQQDTLNTEVWKFTDEENFFSMWATTGNRLNVATSDPAVSDATPTGAVVERTVTISGTGPVPNVVNWLNSIQALTPTISITSLTAIPGTLSGQVTVTIKAATLWQ